MRRLHFPLVVIFLALLTVVSSTSTQANKDRQNPGQLFSDGVRLAAAAANHRAGASRLQARANDKFLRSLSQIKSKTPADCPVRVLFVVGSGTKKLYCYETKCCGPGTPHRGFGFVKNTVSGRCRIATRTCSNPISQGMSNYRLEYSLTLAYHSSDFFPAKLDATAAISDVDPGVTLLAISPVKLVRLDGTYVGNFLLTRFTYPFNGQPPEKIYTQAFQIADGGACPPMTATTVVESGSGQLELAQLDAPALVISDAILVKTSVVRKAAD